MDFVETKNWLACPSPEISAYIDGELSSIDEMALELHLAVCRPCSDDLNLQKTFLNALNSSLVDEETIELPKNFTKAVVANAESRVSGLRRPGERRSAAIICGVLILFSLFALGSNAEKTISAAGSIIDKVVAVVVSIGHLAYDFALGAAIVFRSLSSKFIFESGFSALFFLVVFMLSLYLSSRLLVRFHRT